MKLALASAYNRKHDRYFNKLGIGVSRRTKKYIKNFWRNEFEIYKKSEDYLLSLLPDCKWCNGGGTIRESFYDTGYACPDCRGTGKDGWQYNKDRKIVMMKEFIKPSNNALRLKRKGILKHKRVERCYVCKKKNVYGYRPYFCCSGYMCGCYGLPIEPPLCSVKCEEKVFGKRSKRR